MAWKHVKSALRDASNEFQQIHSNSLVVQGVDLNFPAFLLKDFGGRSGILSSTF